MAIRQQAGSVRSAWTWQFDLILCTVDLDLCFNQLAQGLDLDQVSI